MKSNGCKSRPVKASEQAGSECCHSLGDWWVRSVHSKEAGREGDQLRNLTSLRCRRRLSSGRQHPGTTAIAMGGPGSPESLAQGMFPKGFPMNPGELPISARKSGKTAAKGNRRWLRMDGRAVLRTHMYL